jgi:hypothetical protein
MALPSEASECPESSEASKSPESTLSVVTQHELSSESKPSKCRKGEGFACK